VSLNLLSTEHAMPFHLFGGVFGAVNEKFPIIRFFLALNLDSAVFSDLNTILSRSARVPYGVTVGLCVRITED